MAIVISMTLLRCVHCMYRNISIIFRRLLGPMMEEGLHTISLPWSFIFSGLSLFPPFNPLLQHFGHVY